MMRQLMPLGSSLPCLQSGQAPKTALPRLSSMVNSHCDDSQLAAVFLSQQYQLVLQKGACGVDMSPEKC